MRCVIDERDELRGNSFLPISDEDPDYNRVAGNGQESVLEDCRRVGSPQNKT